MAKPKSSAPKKGKSKKAAASAEDTSQLSLAIPKNRDLKHYISEWSLADKRVKDAEKARKHVEDCANEAGVSVKAIKQGKKICDMPAIQSKADLTQLAMVLEEMGSPIRIQVHDAKYDGPEDEAKVRGFADGKAGKDRNYGTWSKGSPAARAYDEAYEKGQLENMPISAEAKAKAKAGNLEGATAH